MHTAKTLSLDVHAAPWVVQVSITHFQRKEKLRHPGFQDVPEVAQFSSEAVLPH